jgi:protein SCO1/2
MTARAAAAATLAALALLAGCAGSGPAGDAGSTAGQDDGATAFAGGVVEPRRAAPPLRLQEVGGATVDIRRLRGEPVLVTFVYATCPDVCPLIMSTLRAARGAAGPVGERTRVVAVSVDPEGDTPAVVRRFLGARGLTGEVDYLVGSRAELEATWAAWGVARSVPRDDPELVEHSSLIYGVTASGDLATAYPVGIGARAVARDLPLLARS